jgi:putative ABC transport system substrate-binding protein
MAIQIRRREFITLLGGAATAWPLAARAQQPQRMRRIGVLMNLPADNPEGQARLAAFLQGLQETGWAVGHNAQIDIRWGGGDAEQMRTQAVEMVTLAPDVIFASSNPILVPLRHATRTIPIVFAAVIEPVAAGFVESLARPGGNVTGFSSADYGVSTKWLEVLKDIAPRVTRVAVLYNPSNPGALPQFTAISVAASLLRIELSPAAVRDKDEIERAVAAFARIPNGGLIVTRTTEVLTHYGLIVTLAARHVLPTVYPLRSFVAHGGLISYGNDVVADYRRAASYVDRILRGEKPTDLPVQTPTKFELAINLKTAKALGLTVPDSLLARADEVIE